MYSCRLMGLRSKILNRKTGLAVVTACTIKLNNSKNTNATRLRWRKRFP